MSNALVPITLTVDGMVTLARFPLQAKACAEISVMPSGITILRNPVPLNAAGPITLTVYFLPSYSTFSGIDPNVSAILVSYPVSTATLLMILKLYPSCHPFISDTTLDIRPMVITVSKGT